MVLYKAVNIGLENLNIGMTARKHKEQSGERCVHAAVDTAIALLQML